LCFAAALILSVVTVKSCLYSAICSELHNLLIMTESKEITHLIVFRTNMFFQWEVRTFLHYSFFF
jgi:hypothetical protein